MNPFLRLLFLFLLIWQTCSLPAVAASSLPEVSFVGYFSNYTYTDEHQYGSAIALWQYKNTVVGFFYHSEGLQGDTPRGLIDNVKLHPKSGKLSFDSALSMGIHGCKDHKNVPSQDYFIFNGTLRKAAITGQLQRSDKLHPESQSANEKITLKRDKQATFESFDSLDAWQSFVATQLRQPANTR